MEIRTEARVALESAVITHGLPRPHNLEAARAMQHAVRDAGATPHIVAVLHGTPCIGVSDGTNRPYRMHTRAPSFMNLQALEKMAVGRLIADMVALIGSIDIVLGEIDR